MDFLNYFCRSSGFLSDTDLFKPHLASRLNQISFLALPLFPCPFRKNVQNVVKVIMEKSCGPSTKKYMRFGLVLAQLAILKILRDFKGC